jgi:hypothetical protein
MAGEQRAVRIEGLAQLRTAFRVAGTEMSKDLDAALRSSAEPVKFDAQGFAASALKPGKTVVWSSMRVGITRHTVYVAPVQKGTRGRNRRSRPKLFDRLMDRALNPALEANTAKVEQEVKDAIRDMGRAWERVPGPHRGAL